MTIETTRQLIAVLDTLSPARIAMFRRASRAEFVVGNLIRAGFEADGKEGFAIRYNADQLHGRCVEAALDAGATQAQAHAAAAKGRREYVANMRTTAIVMAYRMTQLHRDGSAPQYPAPLACEFGAIEEAPARVSLAKPPLVSLRKRPLVSLRKAA
jgi:hypothetical protein